MTTATNEFSIQPYGVNIPANGIQDIDVIGNVATPQILSGDLYIKFDDGQETYFPQGYIYPLEFGEYRKITLVNKNSSPVTGTVLLGRGRIIDNRLSVTAPIEIKPLATLTSGPDVTIPAAIATLVIGANTSRKRLVITNPVNNTAIFRLGEDNTVAANKGGEFPPGAVYDEAYTGAIWLYSSTVAGEVVTVQEYS